MAAAEATRRPQAGVQIHVTRVEVHDVGHRPGRPPSRSSGLRHGRGSPGLSFFEGSPSASHPSSRSSRRRISALPPVERRTGIRAGSTCVVDHNEIASEQVGEITNLSMLDMVAAVNEEASCVSGPRSATAQSARREGRSRCQRASRGDRSQCRGYGKTGRPSVSWLPIRPEPAPLHLDRPGTPAEEAGLGCGVGRRGWGCHAEVGVRRWRCHTTRGTHQQPLLNQIGS